ncbi:replication factor-A protein 1 [Rickenella mellea]|uniref:Replication protein A subunit n=1 Tax=Rickenella mellea TaxID=50990 RepID=A0A4Y7QCC6_9AGAM|nr:replication factor-A protein 1 [Rickenella mellea]
MDTEFTLTSGIISRLIHAQGGENDLWTSGPTLQFISIKKVPSTSSPVDRYRIIVSDGEKYTQAMLATQLNQMVTDEAIGRHTVARIDKLTCNVVQQRRLIIILGITVLGKASDKIGNPDNIDIPIAVANPTAAPAPAVAQQPIHQAGAPRPQAVPNNRGPVVFPIEGLSPYSNKWTIKARVTQKSDIRQWSNNRGEGQLFNVTLMDESGEIRATGFNQAVKDFYDKLQEGKVYYISKARVNLAKKKFSNLPNEYELALEKNTEIEECLDQSNLPTVKYNFIPLSNLESIEKDATCDVIGVVKEASALGEIVSKTTHRELKKRELTIVDRSGYSVRVTLWGKQAEQYEHHDQPVVAFKGVRVGDFGGRSLSMISTSMMNANPDIPEAHALKGWFSATGSTENFQSHSNAMPSVSSGTFNRAEVRTLSDVKESQLGQSDKPEYFSSRATIVHIKADNISYPACPSEGCNKKVTEGADGQWKCEKCDRSYEKPEHRYIMSMSVADHTEQAWFQGFNDVGLAVFGMPANDLVELRERDDAAYNAVMHKATCNTFNFSCRAKQDTYNEQTRVRYGITRIMPLNYLEEACVMRDLLHSDWAR